jgi:heat shock protein HslJ
MSTTLTVILIVVGYILRTVANLSLWVTRDVLNPGRFGMLVEVKDMDRSAFHRKKVDSYGLRPNTLLLKAKVFFWLLPAAVVLLLAACGGSEVAIEPETNVSTLYVNPYKDECVIAGELQLCYVVSLGDTGDFSPYTGDIQNFEYEWGYEYRLTGTGDRNLFRVEDSGSKVAEPGGEHFPLTITGGAQRIVEIADGVFELYGEKTFTCSPEADCETLKQVIGREEPIEFEFETPQNPADPYTLLSWESESGSAQVGEEPGLMGISWTMDSFTGDDNMVEPMLAGTQITAIFTAGDNLSSGTVSGSTGCNDYTASFTLEGNSIDIFDLEKTEAQCDNPPGIMSQEQRFVSALTVADSFLVNGDTLQINYNSGESALNFVAN